ncbi:MAG TPA: hypothetical protein VMU98_08885 [Acidimicrobiales bacterium]|nr:hypothetical protein [Acidimicrobiales bacterium]
MRSLVLGYCGLVVVYGVLLATMIGFAGWQSDPRSTASSRAKSWVQFVVLLPAAGMCCVGLGFLDSALTTSAELLITAAAVLVGVGVFVIEASVDGRLTKTR